MITSLDKKFLDKAIQVVEKHMSDDSFSVAGLSKELNMSRSTLFRKLEAITNQSPVEFIRAIRLKRAASLLMQRYGNISEVALQVGFKNPSYFTQMFRKAYSKTPKEYAKS
jgi:AraC-like DNA-binding protein